MSDPIDKAIAAAEAKMPELIQVPVRISSTGRPVILAVPEDLTDVEIIELGGFILMGLRRHIAASQQQAASSLVIARGMPQ